MYFRPFFRGFMFWSISFVKFIKLDITRGFFLITNVKSVYYMLHWIWKMYIVSPLWHTQSILVNKRLWEIQQKKISNVVSLCFPSLSVQRIPLPQQLLISWGTAFFEKHSSIVLPRIRILIQHFWAKDLSSSLAEPMDILEWCISVSKI